MKKSVYDQVENIYVSRYIPGRMALMLMLLLGDAVLYLNYRNSLTVNFLDSLVLFHSFHF